MQESGEPAPEIHRSEARWTAEDLHAYLLALAYNSPNRTNCMEQHHFPKQIALSPFWHETFDRMRAETARNSCEYWSMIGATKTRDKIFIPRKIMPGDEFRIAAETISATIAKARQHGIHHLVADIHTHPGRFVEKLVGSHDAFSIADLCGLLNSPRALAVRFLAGPNRNLAVFRSQESELLPVDMTLSSFEGFWNRREYVRLRLGDSLGVNMAIGTRHHLVYYQGSPGQPFLRIFP